MKIFDLLLDDKKIRFICEDYQEILLKDIFEGYFDFISPEGEAYYSLFSLQNYDKQKGEYAKLIDKWFNNASLDCWIDNQDSVCYIKLDNNTTKEDSDNLFQYFAVNLINRILELDGYIAFHSSCAEKEGKAVAFIAPRNAGKTNCMINMLHNGYNFVANDKMAVKLLPDGRIKAFGVPQDISIRMSKEFYEKSENNKYYNVALSQLPSVAEKSTLEGNNIHLTPKEITKLNNVNLSPFTILQIIVNPKYSPSIKNIEFQELQQEESLLNLLDQRLELVHPTKSFLRNIGTDINNQLYEKKLFQALVNLPNYSCIQNGYTTEEFISNIDAAMGENQKQKKYK